MTVLNDDSHSGLRTPSAALARGRVWRGLAIVGGLWTLVLAGATPLLLPAAGAAGGLVAGLAMALATLAAAAGMARHYPHESVGACNLITLSRAAPVALLSAVLMIPAGLAGDPTLAWVLVGLVTLGLSFDGIDGWLARRSGLSSAFGARFDMEVDSALAGLLAAVALVSGKAGVWVLALGFMRYGFVAATAVWPWLDGPLSPSLRRKTVCVIQIGVLIALLAPVVQPPVSVVAGLATLLLLCWSFGIDIRHLWRQRA